MEVSRILRVLVTLLLVVTFIASTIAAYNHNREINAMTTLTDAGTEIASDLSTRVLVAEDPAGEPMEYVLSDEKLSQEYISEEVGFRDSFAGETFEYFLKVESFDGEIDNFYENTPPEDVMTNTVSIPITFYEDREAGKLEVKVWYI